MSLLLAACDGPAAESKDRSQIPDAAKWNLADIYPSDDAWQQAREKWAAAIPAIEKFRGGLSRSPQMLLDCLDLYSRLHQEFSRLSSYAGMASDQDTRDSKSMGMKQSMDPLGATFEAKTSFIDPEILKMGKPLIDSFLEQEKRLAVYRRQLDDILRRQAHTGTEGEERIIAEASLMADGPADIFGVFADADFPYPEVTLSDGKTIRLDKAAFSLHRASPNRADRQRVFRAFFGKLQDYRRTFGTQLYGGVKSHLFHMRARKYDSTLESALDANNIPVQVYHSLVNNVNANLPTFHRYLQLRKRMLGVDELHYYDLYAPLVKGVDLKYSIDEAQKHVLASLAPLGSNYVAVVQKAFHERWIDIYPTSGKRSGAYSNGSAYDVHPYILMNYNGLYNDMSTLTHELGHTMHSHLSNTTQPYALSHYPIFVAEVASTFNEALLIDYLLKTIPDDQVRLSLLGNYLEGIKQTVFRQTQFAEFELRMHELAEKGDALTGDVLARLYEEITRKYYGHDQKVCIVDDEVKAEWSFVPHFYYNFYVYQYATAFTASSALSEQILAQDPAALKRYLEFLSSGGSVYPIQLLKNAGVDRTTPQPLELTMKKMNRVMDDMDKILSRTSK